MANEALQRAVVSAGGQKALAEKIGTRQSLVWYWLNRSKNGVPAEYVERIERETAGAVTRHDLRPDLWPAEQSVEAAA
jgi:DNA-binding transcriptional regulator YdaS (Cro superfamily)